MGYLEGNTIEISLVVIIILISFMVGFLVYPVYASIPDNFALSESSDGKCTGMDLFTTAECLNDELNTWFNYNMTNVGKKLSLDELKRVGGVCDQYSDFYLEKAEELGFYGKKVVFDVGNSSHAIAIISDRTGYCLLDQINMQCWGLKI